VKMTTFGRLPRSRAAWLVPVVIFGVVVGGGVALSSASASGDPTLPSKSAAELLTAVEGSSAVALSGTVSETARFGLPSLPGADGGASLDWQSLITGSHTALVSVAGADKQRVALLGSLAESDFIRNGQDLWTYVSSTNAVTHTVLSGKDGAGSTPATPDADARSLTPAGAAQKVLAAIDPSTVVTVDATQVVAGEKAYTLVLTPRDTRSTVHKVTIAIDATHYVPLQVEVFGASSTPAFQTGFIDNVSFAMPAASVFEFHAPAGASTAPDPLGVNRLHHDHGTPTPGGSAAPAISTPSSSLSDVKVIGTGWTSIAELPNGLPAGSMTGLLSKLSTPVGTSGDKIITTALVNVLTLSDGRVFLGAVSADLLEQTATATPR
jgi:outer membrane lipoprotein-sorting protein